MEIIKCIYELKQSNHVFNQDFNRYMIAGKYLPLPSDPHTYMKRCIINPLNSTKTSMNVDDGQFICNNAYP